LEETITQKRICSICEIPIAENFCSRCGQKFTPKPTSTLSLIVDFFSNFFSLEKSGFATILKILKNPKPIVENYYSGYKNYYASPGKILLYGIGVVALHVNFVDEKILGLSLNLDNLNKQYSFWLALLPFLLFASYLSFIRIEKSFSKHLISLIYIATPWFMVITILNDLIFLVWDKEFNVWPLILYIILVFFWNSRVFTSKNKKWFVLWNTIIQLAVFMGIIGIIVLTTNQYINN